MNLKGLKHRIFLGKFRRASSGHFIMLLLWKSRTFLKIWEVFIDNVTFISQNFIVAWITFIYVWLRFERFFSYHRASLVPSAFYTKLSLQMSCFRFYPLNEPEDILLYRSCYVVSERGRKYLSVYRLKSEKDNCYKDYTGNNFCKNKNWPTR